MVRPYHIHMLITLTNNHDMTKIGKNLVVQLITLLKELRSTLFFLLWRDISMLLSMMATVYIKMVFLHNKGFPLAKWLSLMFKHIFQGVNNSSHHLHYTTLKCGHQYPQIVNMCTNHRHWCPQFLNDVKKLCKGNVNLSLPFFKRVYHQIPVHQVHVVEDNTKIEKKGRMKLYIMTV